MRIVELILDEEQMLSGVQAISIVEHPAIESDFITLSKEQEIKTSSSVTFEEDRLSVIFTNNALSLTC